MTTGRVAAGALHELVAAADPDRVALAGADGAVVPYGALARDVERLARRLAMAGVGAGDTVVVVAGDLDTFAPALLAVTAAGAAAAPMDPRIARPEAAARLAALRPRALLAGRQAAPAVRAAARAAGVPVWTASLTATHDVELDGARRGERTPAAAATGDDVAVVLATSGTTAPPKHVPLTHANVLASLRGIVATYHLAPEDRTLALLPLFHGHGLIGALLATLSAGGAIVEPARGRFSASAFWSDVARARPTWLTTVPAILQIVLARARPAPTGEPHPRFVRTCSAPLAPAVRTATEQAFGAPVIEAYGMTETAHQATSNPLPTDGPVKAGTVGVATAGDVRIGPGGEVELRGPAVTAGYLDAPDATAAAFDGPWLRTGDLGRLDADGYLALTGRIKELINRGGEKIAPAHVDAALVGHPAVLDAAAYGVPDRTLGEAVEAAVVVRPGRHVTAAELQAFCRDRLAAFEVPARIRFVTRLPRTPKGSVDRRRLAALGADDRARAASDRAPATTPRP